MSEVARQLQKAVEETTKKLETSKNDAKELLRELHIAVKDGRQLLKLQKEQTQRLQGIFVQMGVRTDNEINKRISLLIEPKVEKLIEDFSKQLGGLLKDANRIVSRKITKTLAFLDELEGDLLPIPVRLEQKRRELKEKG